MSQQEKSPVAAIGVYPIEPAFYFDVDRKEGYDYAELAAFARINELKDWDVYETRDGWAIVCKDPGMTWDDCQWLLFRTRKWLPNAGYTRHCREVVLRISPKWDAHSLISKAPELLICHCPGEHHDKRLEGTKKQGYWTSS